MRVERTCWRLLNTGECIEALHCGQEHANTRSKGDEMIPNAPFHVRFEELMVESRNCGLFKKPKLGLKRRNGILDRRNQLKIDRGIYQNSLDTLALRRPSD